MVEQLKEIDRCKSWGLCSAVYRCCQPYPIMKNLICDVCRIVLGLLLFYLLFSIPLYEWVVLPQGMVNSPTMCQLFVCHAIAPIREKYPAVRCVHYMDDILLTSKELKLLYLAYRDCIGYPIYP